MKKEKLYDLSMLESISKNNKSILNELIQTFIEKMRTEVSELKSHILNRNWQDAANVAHKIRPSLGYMGVKRAELYLNQIENDCKEETNHDHLLKLITETEEILEIVIKDLEEELRNNQ